MQISLLHSLALAAILLTLGVLRRPWLAGVWVIAFLLLPTAHIRFAGAPIYVYDLVSVILIVSFVASGEANRWPRGMPRWHWWFIGSAFLLSVGFGMLRIGLAPDILWIWGHASLAWIAFAFGILFTTTQQRDAYRNALQWGFLASAAALCGIAVCQFADLSGSEQIARFFYGDLGSVNSVEILRLGAGTKRATGPHFAPTSFSGVALLSIIAGWFLTTPHQRCRRALLLTLFTTVIICTVSRHIMLAALIGLLVLICLSDARTNIKAIGVTVLVVATVSTPAFGLATKKSWESRIAKWERGILNDENIAARILWGPERLARYIVEHPSVLVTGAGLDVEKLATRSDRMKRFESGFVSNGFLLSLYYLGVGGFVLYAVFWLWTLSIAHRSPPETRGILVASTVTMLIIVAADNYSFLHEPAVCLLFLNVGLMAGTRYAALSEKYAEEEAFEGPPALSERAYAGSAVH